MNATTALYDGVYSSEAVIARIGHLYPPMRQDVERFVRILRERFPASEILKPAPRINWIMLGGRQPRRCWSGGEEGGANPTFDSWIVVSDPLLTQRRLWQAAEVRIRDAVEGRCTVSLSFTSTGGQPAGKRSGDEYVCHRLNTSIVLYFAKRDDPRSRRSEGRKAWAAVSGRFDEAEQSLQSACIAFREGERAYCALRAARGFGLSNDEDYLLHIEAGLNVAMAKEQRLGAERHEAAMPLLQTPAPDLAAISRQLELVRDKGDGDDHAVVSIVADVRWIAARIAAFGRPS